MLLEHGRFLQLPPALLLLLASSASAQLPYTPTHLFRSPQNRSLAYVFRPLPDAGGVEFASFSADADINESISVEPLYNSLPFLQGGARRAFVPAIDQRGNLSVYSGRCSDGAAGAELWTFTLDDDDPNGNGTWTAQSVTRTSEGQDTQLAGANYLASGISFSSVVNGTSSFYTFGGMCPVKSAASETTTWQKDASYSNLLVTLSNNEGAYSLQAASTGSKPIAEAGFSVTGLAPSYSNNSDGTQNMQQNFVMIGGHTQAAFINMSQVALFSLPQGSWNFLPIDQPQIGHTDLALRTDAPNVVPRSGHSAVLSADGTKIVVFGGWIGTIETAAEPQLAVLNVGAGYGGSGTWSWSVPENTGTPPAPRFGHGAMLLEDGVMMITGGYDISSTSSRLRGRAVEGLSASTATSFYNITSGTWTSSYRPERGSGPSTADIDVPDGGALHTTAQKVGLGVGLGLGALAVVALLIFYFWYTRRLQRKREAREEEINKLTQNADRFTGDGYDAAIPASGYYGHGPYSEKAMQAREDMASQHGWRSTSGHDVERSGLYVDIPSPTRGLRRGGAAKNGYHPAPLYDEKRASRASGHIGPIEESDEEHMGSSGAIRSLQAYHQKKRSNASAFSNATTLDPFTDPLRSHPTSLLLPDKYEVSAHPAHQIVAQSLRRDLVSDNREMGGRVSPTKSDRTSSTLSETTSRSGITSRSAGSGPQTGTLVGTLARNLSFRSAGLLNAIGLTATTVDPFRTPRDSPTQEHPDEFARPRTKESEKTGSSQDGQSFYSARSGVGGGFDKLRAESEALLGDDAHTPRDIDRFASLPYDSATPGQSPTRQDALPAARSASFAGGVLGSVRRALGAGARRQTTAAGGAARSASFASRHPALSAGAAGRSGHGSPTKARNGAPAAMQRSVSDAGAWSARRSGARDWLGARYRYGEDWDNDPAQEGEEDWDVEGAANERNVQVMFTVPRERLRVVNAEVDVRSLLSSVDGEAVEERGMEQIKGEHEQGRSDGISGSPHATRTL